MQPSSSSAAAASSTSPGAYSVNCVIDRDVLNADTFPDMTQVGLSLFAPLCGRNRGVFVTSPGDGKTYGCADLPADFASRAAKLRHGTSEDTKKKVPAYPLVDANAIGDAYRNGTLTGADAVNVLDLLVQMIYHSSGDGVASDVHACDVSGLTMLSCLSVPPRSHPRLRAATLAGVLSSSTPWATGGRTLTVDEARGFYTAADFDDMANLGLNTVQIPVSSQVFTTKTETSASQLELLRSLIIMANDREMNVIVQLEDDGIASAPDDPSDSDRRREDATRSAATFLADAKKKGKMFTGLILPSPSLVAAARQVSTEMDLFVKESEGNLPELKLPSDPHLFLALDRTHTASVADVASSASLDDRLKMFYHENLACQGRAPVEFGWCYQHTPVYIFRGFNIAIDDCVLQDQRNSSFSNYGQCDRFGERVHSPWWHAHRASFASRQLAGYETGMGWTFDAWKLFDEDPDAEDVLDRPSKLYALRNVAKSGLFPSLRHTSGAHYKRACLNNPESDFVLGDDTLAPTPGPPPDCGNGWWNYDTLQCDYWIPPIPPTPCPTVEPIPTCENDGFWSPDLGSCDYCPEPLTRAALMRSGLVGVTIGLLAGLVITGLWHRRRRPPGYTAVPTVSINV
jgi:hypothetical protein